METIFHTERLSELEPKLRKFVIEELIPLEKDHLTRPFKQTEIILQSKREEVKKLGLWGLHLSKEEGGQGLTLCEFGQLSEVMSLAPYYGQYTFNCQAPDIGNYELISRFGSDAIKEKFLHPLLEGKIRSCFSMTEPEYPGSNPTRLGTTAVRDGDEYVINGHKWFTSSADGAEFAIVMAVTNPDAAPHERASMIIVPTNTPGFNLVRNIPIFGETGEGWASHAEIVYTNCRVPLTNLIGTEGMGFRLAQERLGPGRIHHCMRWIGIAEKALDLLCKRAVSREMEEGVMLGQKQFIQGFIAESRVEIDAARLLVLNTADCIDKHGAKATRDQISGIKFYVANMFLKVLDRAIQVHGGMGLTDETMLANLYQHERGARIWDGADEVHKQSIAIHILKKYGLDLKKEKMMQLDHSIPLKQGEQFDIELLKHYLEEHAPTIGKIISVTRFPGGYSNITYCLHTESKELVLRMPPAGASIQSAHDMGREFRVLNLLQPHFNKVPTVYHYCESLDIIGSPFYIMERINGVVLRAGNAPKMQIDPSLMNQISIALVDNLVALHAIDIVNTELIQLGKPDGYVNRQVTGWIKRYYAAETDTIENMNRIADWLSKNFPRDQQPTFLHNDYKYDNVILDPNHLTSIIGVLDWEMATVGDPLMDLGASLAYWFEAGEESIFKTYNLTWLPGNISRKEFADRYAEKTNRDLSDIVFYYVFGLFKNAVIGQQIYHRWKQGNSNDARFGALLPLIQLLSLKAVNALDSNHI